MPPIFSVWEKQKIRHRVTHRLLDVDLDESFTPTCNEEMAADVFVSWGCSVSALKDHRNLIGCPLFDEGDFQPELDYILL